MLIYAGEGGLGWFYGTYRHFQARKNALVVKLKN
jgi:hypothetical protein